METYYYCESDNYGQKTGYVKSINLTSNQIEIDRHGMKYYKGIFLYKSKTEANTSSLN